MTRGLVALACACLVLTASAANASAAPTWLAPQDLSEAGQNASGPQIELDAAGNAIAVWRRYDGSNNRVQVSERPAGGEWSEPLDLSAQGQGASAPQLAINAVGDAVVVWESGGVNAIVQASERPAGGDWSEPEDLSAPGPDAEMPRVAIDAGGDAVALWLHTNPLPGDASTFIVQASTRPAGGDWSEPQDLGDQGHNLDGPELAVNAAGDAIAVWDADLVAGDFIRAATRPADGDWSAPQDLPGSEPGYGPQVAIDPAGNAVVGWSGLFTQLVQAAERPTAGGWSEPETLSAPGGEPTPPRLAVDAAGNATAVWARSDGSNQIVQASARLLGGDWSPPRDLSAPGRDAQAPYVAVDAAGDALAVWRRSDGSNEIVQASARPLGGDWSQSQDLSAPGQSAFAPQVAVDPAGNAVAVWPRSNGSNDIVQAAAYDVVPPELRNFQMPATGTVGEPVSFSVSPFDAFSAVAATSWSFGDGEGASGNAASHVYGAAGTYPVTVTAVDSGGNTSAQTGTIAIAPPPGGHPGPPPGPPKPPLRLSSLEVERISLRKLRRTRKLVVTTTVNGPAKVTLTGRAKLKVRVRGKSRAKFVTVFKRKTVRFVAADERKVTLALSRKGRRVLRGLRKVRLAIAGTATDAAGKTASKRVTLTLRR